MFLQSESQKIRFQFIPSQTKARSRRKKNKKKQKKTKKFKKTQKPAMFRRQVFAVQSVNFVFRRRNAGQKNPAVRLPDG
uniref:Uncharacterized protein n=1 Tax=Romanomermis culicivorax TaxID=13658 RepID=A0A915L432_ROMCU